MGRPVAPVWNLTYFGKRAIRTTLLAGKCDASIGLPQDKDFMGPKVIFSKPLIDVVPGRGSGFSLEAPLGVRFLTRSRVFTDEEAVALEEIGPLPRGGQT